MTMRRFSAAPILSWITTALLLAVPASGYGEEPQRSSTQSSEELNEKTKQDLQELKKDMGDLKKASEEMNEGMKKWEETEKKTDPLIEKINASLKQERYAEARQAIDEWEKITPADPQIPAWRDLTDKLEKEPSRKKREELYLQFVSNLMGAFADQLDAMNQKLTAFNKEVKELGPQNVEEELCGAIDKGDKAKVEELLGKGVSANAKDRLENTALSHAVYSGNAEIVKLLLARGADVNQKGLLGMTVLISAASKGNSEVIKDLIAAGADVNAKTETGVTALSVAKKNTRSEVVELLKQAGAQE